MAAPLDERHCRAEMRPGSGIFCGRHKGHDKEPGDAGHRQRGADGGAMWQDVPGREPMTAAGWLVLNDDLERLRAENAGLRARLDALANPAPSGRIVRARRLLEDEPEAAAGRDWLDVALDVIERLRAR